jgi:hypothetical protein
MKVTTVFLAVLKSNKKRKEVKSMKIKTSLLAALLLAGNLGIGSAMAASDGVLLKEPLTPGSYCHLKFPEITNRSLYADHPVLESKDSGNVIDFYGPCDENPLGMDQVSQQRVEDLRHRSLIEEQ